MTVEAATYISELNTAYPEAGSAYQDVDNHLRLLKSVQKASFPSVSGPVTASHTELSLLAGATGTILTTATAPSAGQWVHMKSTSVTSAVTEVDFVNGTGGVIIGPTYDQYQVVIVGLGPAAITKSVQLLVSTNAGATWEVSGFNAQYMRMASGVQTVGQTTTAGYFPITAEGTMPVVGSASVGLYATVDLCMHPENPNMVAMKAEFSWHNGSRSGVVHGKAEQSADINGFRVRLNDASSFSANGAWVRFYGRKT